MKNNNRAVTVKSNIVSKAIDLKKRLINFGWYNLNTLKYQAINNNNVANFLLEYELNKDTVCFAEYKQHLEF